MRGLPVLNFQALIFGKPQFGMCIPSTCSAQSFENFMKDKVDKFLGGLPVEFTAEVGDYHYTSDLRPWTAGDIITM